MSAENFPYEKQMLDDELRMAATEGFSFISGGIPNDNDRDTTERKHLLHVNIISSDKRLIKEFSDIFNKDGYTVGNRLHKPNERSAIVSKVTIHPKRRYRIIQTANTM